MSPARCSTTLRCRPPRCLPCKHAVQSPSHATLRHTPLRRSLRARPGLWFEDSLARRYLARNRRRHASLTSPLGLVEGQPKCKINFYSLQLTVKLTGEPADTVSVVAYRTGMHRVCGCDGCGKQCMGSSSHIGVVPRYQCYERKPYRKLLSMPLRAAPKRGCQQASARRWHHSQFAGSFTSLKYVNKRSVPLGVRARTGNLPAKACSMPSSRHELNASRCPKLSAHSSAPPHALRHRGYLMSRSEMAIWNTLWPSVPTAIATNKRMEHALDPPTRSSLA